MCYEGFYACKRSAESQTLKVHPVASKTLTQSMLPQNASLEISHFPLFTSWVLWRVNTQRPHPLPAFHETSFSFEARKRLVTVTFWPVLDYGDLIYMNAPAHCLERLDAAYHSALRFVTNCKALTHHCTLYAKAGLPSLTVRRLSHWYIQYSSIKPCWVNSQLIYALWSHREWQVAIAWDPRMCFYYMCQVLGLF